MTLIIANTVSVAIPILAFMAGIYFAKWMGERRRRRRTGECWYREMRR